VFTAVSDEARAKHQQAKRTGNVKRYQGLSYWTPNINIFRDPRWGRGQETYGEDPYLTGKMGLAVVRGLQGPDNTKYRKLLACAKHFAVHSGPEWNRHTFNIEDLPERDLWETYLPAFKTLVQEGKVAEVMCAYQRIDGQPCCAQTRYEQQILRDEWGFQGLITSDCGAIRDFLPQWHNTAKDGAEASAKAVIAGTDVECGSEYRRLPEAVRRGDIKESDIDRSLRRLLIARFQLGDFDDDALVEWTKIPESVIASKEHKQLALNIGNESIVLLKNNGVLPLKSRFVVMGPKRQRLDYDVGKL
jgi:beta-glucosidase